MRGGSPGSHQKQIVPLIEVGIASIRPTVKLAGKRRSCRGRTRPGSRCEVQVEEVTGKRITLVIYGMAPRIGGLEIERLQAISHKRRQCVVIGFPLSRPPRYVRKGQLRPSRSDQLGKLPIYDVC